MGHGMTRLSCQAFVCLLLSCALVLAPPLTTGAWAFFLGGVSLKDEKAMGRKFDVMVRSHLPMVDDPEVRQYIREVLDRLVRSIPPQPFEFQSAVILHNALNAFAVPGGHIYVFTGLLMNMENEAELAAVLAHELAHVTQRHVASRMERAQYLTIGSLLAAIAGIALGGPAGAAAAVTAVGAGQSAMLNYSRLDESESDNIGLQYLMAAGYPPKSMIDGFKIMRQKSWMTGMSIPTYLSTHPAIGDRINSLASRMAAMPSSSLNKTFNNNRFKRVQTLLWGRYGDEKTALQRFNGKDGLSLMGRGMVLSRLNRVNEAEQAFARAVATSPEDSLILREAGIFHYRKGSLPRARDLLTRALRNDPKDYMASFFYGRLLDDEGRNTEAQGRYADVLRHVPQDSEVHETLARSYGQSGNNYMAHIHLTYSALYANNRKQAERYLAQARQLANKATDKKPMQRLEAAWKERKEIWDKS